MRIAAIDIGTNSIHMVIARSTGPGAFEVVDREREVVQVGRGSFISGRLRAEAIQRTADALARFVRLARRHQVDRILCTATAAVREARNGGDFLAAARAASGVTPRVIPGEEEGRLIYLGIKSAIQLGPDAALMVDIGGGSAQLVVGNDERMMFAVSAPLGALRLTERMIESDPPSRRELQRLARCVRKGLRDPLEAVAEHEPVAAYGSSGSIHALAHVAHWMEYGQPIRQINGHVLSLDALQRLTRRLRKMSVAERERLPGIDAKRAEIIVPGAEVLSTVLSRLGLEEITVSDFGVREGLVTDWLASHAQEVSRLDQVENLKLRSVLQLASKFEPNLPHAQHVAKLALALFDGMRARHGLGDAEREALNYAALLHDIGSAIGYDGHAEHAYYIIRHGNLRGLSDDEVELIANVARFHSKAKPRKREKSYRDLAKTNRKAVRWLAALLRIAEGLDRSHYQLVRGVRVMRGRDAVTMRVSARGDAQLELWAARRRSDLLAELIDAPVRIALERVSVDKGQNGAVAKPARAKRRVTRKPVRRAAQRVRPARRKKASK